MPESTMQDVQEDDQDEKVFSCLTKCEDALFGCVHEYPPDPGLCALTFSKCTEICACIV